MKSYEDAGSDNLALLRRVMMKHHTDLDRAKINVLLVFVSTDNDSPPLTKSGHPCAAICKVLSDHDRFTSHGMDAVIDVDAAHWQELTDKQRFALLDHELSHVVLATDSEGLTRRREDASVIAKLNPDDYMMTGFYAVIKRHGSDAVEAMTLKAVVNAIGSQKVFDWTKSKGAGKAEPKRQKEPSAKRKRTAEPSETKPKIRMAAACSPPAGSGKTSAKGNGK